MVQAGRVKHRGRGRGVRWHSRWLDHCWGAAACRSAGDRSASFAFYKRGT